MLGHDHQVAAQGQVGADPCCRAVDGGDDRELAVEDGRHEGQLALEHHAPGLTDGQFGSVIGARGELPADADVGPRAEQLGALGGDDDGPGNKGTGPAR